MTSAEFSPLLFNAARRFMPLQSKPDCGLGKRQKPRIGLIQPDLCEIDHSVALRKKRAGAHVRRQTEAAASMELSALTSEADSIEVALGGQMRAAE